MKKYLSEAIGTFFLVLIGTGAIVLNDETTGSVTHIGISAAFGLAVLLMIILFGKISGAHINPAVTISLALNKSFEKKLVLPYIGSQIFGAFAASLLLKFIYPANELLGTTLPVGSAMQSFWLEFFLTFILMLVILKTKGVVAIVLIGLTVGLEAYFAGPICGASMNPARSLSPAVVSQHVEHLWIYIVAPVLGAIVAVIFNKLVFK